jgi:hypothetical protein
MNSASNPKRKYFTLLEVEFILALAHFTGRSSALHKSGVLPAALRFAQDERRSWYFVIRPSSIFPLTCSPRWCIMRGDDSKHQAAP